MLQNRIYRGEIVHKNQAYPGEHAPIIDEDLWQKVQTTLAENRVDRGAGNSNHQVSLLAGLIYDAHGELMTPSHAVKKSVRYRYYVSKLLLIGGIKAEEKGQRIPASHIEALVTGRIRGWLADPVAVLNALQRCRPDAVAQKRLLDNAAWLAASWQDLDAERLGAILRAVVTRVQVYSDRVDLTLDQMGVALWLNAKDRLRFAQPESDDQERHLMVLTIPARLKRTGIEMRMVVEDGSEPATVDRGLVRLLARAHAIRARVLEEPSLTLQEIAAEEGVSSSYATRLLRLAFLAPDIVAAILNGRHPPQLTANRLMDDTRLPLDWSAQRELLYSYSAEAASFSPDVHPRLRLASRSLTKNCGLDRETAVLPTHATRDEAAKRRRIGAPKESLATTPDEACVQGSENAGQFALRQDRKRLLYQ